MFVRVNIDQNYSVGTAVAYDSDSLKWSRAANGAQLFGFVEQTGTHEDGTFWGQVRFGGVSHAVADRAIPDEGGYLGVLDGRVYVSTANDHCGIIAPISHSDTSSRGENDLVLVYIR